jgi:hypothetical protein
MAKSRGSRTATPKVKDCSTNKQQLNNKQQQFNNSTIQQKHQQLQSCWSSSCVCFLFDFISSYVVVFVSCLIVVMVVSCSISDCCWMSLTRFVWLLLLFLLNFPTVSYLTRPRQGLANSTQVYMKQGTNVVHRQVFEKRKKICCMYYILYMYMP